MQNSINARRLYHALAKLNQRDAWEPAALDIDWRLSCTRSPPRPPPFHLRLVMLARLFMRVCFVINLKLATSYAHPFQESQHMQCLAPVN